VRALVQARGVVLAIEAERTVMLERAEMIAAADAAGLAIVAVAEDPGGTLADAG
jgi:DUF1009 family protein